MQWEWAWEHDSGREEVGGVGGVGAAFEDWQPDLVNKSAENNCLDFLACNYIYTRRT